MSKQSSLTVMFWKARIVGILACVALTGLTFVVAWRPVVHRNDEARQLKAQVVELSAQAEAADSMRLDLVQQLLGAEAALKASHITLQTSDQLNARLSSILEATSRAELSVNELVFGDVAEGEHFTSVPLKLTGLGTYPECGRFLHEIAGVMPDVRVHTFKLSRGSESGDMACHFSFDLLWYAAPSVAQAD